MKSLQISFVHTSYKGSYLEEGVIIQYINGFCTQDEIDRFEKRRNRYIYAKSAKRNHKQSALLLDMVSSLRKNYIPSRLLDTGPQVLILYFDQTLQDYTSIWKRLDEVTFL